MSVRLISLSLSCLLGLLGARPVIAAQEEDAAEPLWALVHGSTEAYGSLSLDRIAEVYLRGRRWTKVAAADLKLSEWEGPLFVVGSLSDNPVAQALTLPLIRSDRKYLGRDLEPGIGLVHAGRRPNAQPFCIFTGLDDDAVYQCFTTTVDLTARRDFVIREGRILVDWAWPRAASDEARPLVHDPASVALSLLAGRPSAAGPPGTAAERAELAARALDGYAAERELLGSAGDLPSLEVSRRHLLQLLHAPQDRLGELRDWAAGRDLTELVHQVHEQVVGRLGPSRRPAPAVFLLLDAPEATNARTAGIDPHSGRPRVVLNLACFPNERSFRIALVHELIHCLQLDEEGRLAGDPMLVEGVAVFLTERVLGRVPRHELLMWSEDHLDEAQSKAEEAAAAFREAQAAGGPLNAWFTLGVRPRRGEQSFPDRMGYYLGWSAAQRWAQAHPNHDPAELLRLPANSLLGHLPTGDPAWY